MDSIVSCENAVLYLKGESVERHCLDNTLGVRSGRSQLLFDVVAKADKSRGYEIDT